MACVNNPADSGEAISTPTEWAPADSPKMVTLSALPPLTVACAPEPVPPPRDSTPVPAKRHSGGPADNKVQDYCPLITRKAIQAILSSLLLQWSRANDLVPGRYG